MHHFRRRRMETMYLLLSQIAGNAEGETCWLRLNIARTLLDQFGEYQYHDVLYSGAAMLNRSHNVRLIPFSL